MSTPYFFILHAKGGAGKSMLCTHAPNPFYLALEHGVDDIDGIGSFKHKNPHTGEVEIKLPKSAAEFFEAAK